MPHSNPRTHRHSTLPSDMRPHNRKSDSLYWFLLSALTAIRQKESIILQTVSFDNLSAFALTRIYTSRLTLHRSNSLPDPLEKYHPSCAYAFRTRMPNRRSKGIRTARVAFPTKHPCTSGRTEAETLCTPCSLAPMLAGSNGFPRRRRSALKGGRAPNDGAGRTLTVENGFPGHPRLPGSGGAHSPHAARPSVREQNRVPGKSRVIA